MKWSFLYFLQTLFFKRSNDLVFLQYMTQKEKIQEKMKNGANLLPRADKPNENAFRSEILKTFCFDNIINVQ